MDDDLILKRLKDLSKRSYNNNTFEFSDFLTVQEQDELDLNRSVFAGSRFRLFGGYKLAERRMVRFGDEEEFGYNVEFPISCIEISPVSEKFAKAYTHRDFLGALMSLGLERRIFGDIIVKDKCAYLFCEERFASFICDNLVSVGRNPVHCEICLFPEENVKKEREKISVQVNSPRADAVVAKVCRLSRGAVLPLFMQKHVILNGQTLENKDKALKEGDIFSVRGYGKFVVGESTGLSRKGKENVNIYKYM
jgi:RNA-binding protein YlmH